MVVKVKEKFDKTRDVEKMINLKNIFYEEKEIQDILINSFIKKTNHIIYNKFVTSLNFIN